MQMLTVAVVKKKLSIKSIEFNEKREKKKEKQTTDYSDNRICKD
jgi:hypothetical protein